MTVPEPTPQILRKDALRICTSLDVLVRSTRADRASAERLAPRIAESLRGLPGPLSILPRAIGYEGTPLEAVPEAVAKAASGARRWAAGKHAAN